MTWQNVLLYIWLAPAAIMTALFCLFVGVTFVVVVFFVPIVIMCDWFRGDS